MNAIGIECARHRGTSAGWNN